MPLPRSWHLPKSSLLVTKIIREEEDCKKLLSASCVLDTPIINQALPGEDRLAQDQQSDLAGMADLAIST